MVITADTPLRYPGGKGRAKEQISMYFPQDIPALVSPFFGGGAIELHIAKEWDIEVMGYDIFQPVVNFWQWAIRDGSALADYALNKFGLKIDRTMYYRVQTAYPERMDIHSIDAAACYFMMNRCSWGGKVFRGFSVKNAVVWPSALSFLSTFHADNVWVEELDFMQTIARYGYQDFLYCDPPYLLNDKTGLYGFSASDLHWDFPHDKLAQILYDTPSKWALSYADHPTIREYYQGLDIVELHNWSPSMMNGPRATELLIKNY